MSVATFLPPWIDPTGLAALLLLVPLVTVLLAALERRSAARRSAALGPRAERLAPSSPAGRATSARLLFAAGLLLAGNALLHPGLGARASARTWRGLDVVVALDVSRSMRARDLSPDRLGHAQAEVRALSDAAEGDRLGLVLFAGEARVRVPLTRDRAIVARLASEAGPDDVGRGGTDLGAALDAAAGLLERGAEDHGPAPRRLVLLLTDGEDHAGRAQGAARRLAERGVALHVLGLGGERGARLPERKTADGPERHVVDRTGTEVLSRLDVAGLEALASAGGGTFLRAGREPRLPALLRAQARAGHGAAGAERAENRYAPFLAAALLCFLLEAHLRRRRAPVVRHDALPVRGTPAHALLLLAVALGATGCGREESAAVRLTREGRHREALAAYEADLARAGAAASPALHLETALAALRAGEPERAARASIELQQGGAERGGPSFERWTAFVRGHVAFARSLAAEAEATRPGGNAALLERALTLAEDALAAWRLAASRTADWPEARRNVERALLRLEGLRERQRTGASTGRRPVVVPPPPGTGGTEAPPQPTPPPPPGTGPQPEPVPGGETTPDAGARVVTTDLAPADLGRLPEVLRRKEAERRREQRGQGRRAGPPVEKDW